MEGLGGEKAIVIFVYKYSFRETGQYQFVKFYNIQKLFEARIILFTLLDRSAGLRRTPDLLLLYIKH